MLRSFAAIALLGFLLAPAPARARNIEAACRTTAECNDGAGQCGANRCFCDTRESPNVCVDRGIAGFDCTSIGNAACQDGFRCNPDRNVCVQAAADAKAAPAEADKKAAGAAIPRLLSPIGAFTLQQYAGRVIRAGLGIAGSLALVMFVWGGFVYLTSRGESAKIELGKKTLVWAAIGLLVLFGAYALVSFVLTALGQAT